LQAIDGLEPAHAELALIAGAAREAGRIAMRHFRNEPKVWWKEGDSPVTEGDLAVDAFLKQTLLGARPDHGWLSEETIDKPHRLSAARTFVVDPIDGTRAFMNGRSTWCISIAVVEKGRAIAGVLECPAMRETYLAVAGGGAALDGKPIRVREPATPATLAGPKRMIAALPPEVRQRVKPYGYVPSLAYRLAMVARGSLDATFVKPNAHDWDLAAADLILREAGGAIRNRAGAAPAFAGPDARHGSLAAGSGWLLEAMTVVISSLEE